MQLPLANLLFLENGNVCVLVCISVGTYVPVYARVPECMVYLQVHADVSLMFACVHTCVNVYIGLPVMQMYV